MDDTRIIELYFERSEQAIEETGLKYGAFLDRTAYCILRDRTDAEEVVNDTYLGAWKAIPPERPAALKHFLSRITRNLAFDRLDRRSAKKRGGDTGTLLDELNECIPDQLGGVEQAWEARELARSLNRFLASLNQLNLAIFLSRYYYSASIAEIAEKYTISQRRAKYLLSKMRAALKEHLQKEEALI